MGEDDVTKLYTNSFDQARLENFLSLLSSKQQTINKQLTINDQYSAVVADCHQLLSCSDAQGKELPVYVIKLQSKGELIDLDQEFIELHLSEQVPYLLAAIYHPDQQEWYLSLIKQKLELARNYYFVCNNQISSWVEEQLQALVNKRKVLWSDLEAIFSSERLKNQFITDCEALISDLEAEVGRQAAGELILQLVVVFLLQQQGWLGAKEDWSAGDEEFLLTLYQNMDEQETYWQDYLLPLIDKLSATSQAVVNYADYKLPCLGETVNLLLEEQPVADQLLKQVLVTFNQYNFSLQENTPWQQQVSLTPKLLSDLFEQLVKDDQRKKRGVVYTPSEIVNYLVQEGVINYLAAKFEQLEQKVIRQFIYRGQLAIEIKAKAAEIDQQLAEFKLCDPAVGSGAFAVGAQQELVRLRRKLARFIDREQSLTQLRWEIVVNSIYGVEINPRTVKITRLRLWFNSVANGQDYSQLEHISLLKYNCVSGNSLLTEENNLFNCAVQQIKELQDQYHQTDKVKTRYQLQAQIDELLAELPADNFSFFHYFPAVFSDQDGFDLVLGNPPYVGEKGNKDLFRKIQDYSLGKFYQGKMDLFYFFFHLGLDLVTADGHLIYITTNYFLRATGARKLRTDLKERATVKKLIDFNELKLFPAAIGQHNLISVLQKGRRDLPAQTVVTNRKGTAVTKDLSYLLYGTDEQTNYYSVPQSLLYEGPENYLRLEQGIVAKILADIKQQGVPLGELCNINQGIVTGCDRISGRHLNRYDLDLESGRGVFVVDQNQVEKFDLSNKAKWFKPWFKNSHIEPWIPQQEDSEERLLYLDDKVEKLPEEVREHLSPVRKVLAQRREARQGRINWWQLQWPREETIFTAPKLIAPQRHRYNVFAYTEASWYASADVYYITSRDSRCKLKYLLALLNSELYYLWLYKKGKKKGDILELYQRPLSEVPIKVISVDCQQEFVDLVDQLIAAKHKLRQLTSINWQELLPAEEPVRQHLQKLAAEYQVYYQGQAQKVRKIKVEVEASSALIYSARDQGGWYKVLRLQLEDKKLGLYLKYQLENLTSSDRKQINNSSQGLVNRILNIKLPLYPSALRNDLVKDWRQLQLQQSSLQETIEQKTKEINKLVYDLYGLNKQQQAEIKKEIQVIKAGN